MSEQALKRVEIDAGFKHVSCEAMTTGINTLLMFRRSLGSTTATIRSWAKTSRSFGPSVNGLIKPSFFA